MQRFRDILIAFFRPEQKSAEQSRLEDFLKATPSEYCGWDKTGAQAISSQFCALLGVGAVTTIEDIQAAITAGDAAALEGLYERLRREGRPFDINVNTVISGKTLKMSGRGGGDNSFAVVWAEDITGFARAALQGMEAVNAAEKRENHLRDALNALPLPIWIRDAHLALAWCNKFFAHTVDDTGAAVVAEQKFLPLTGSQRGDERALAQNALAGQKPESARRHALVDGHRRLLNITETPLTGGGGLVGIAVDITKEEELELAQRQTVGAYHEAMEQLRTAIALFDRETRLEFYNSAYEQMTGLSGAWLNAKPKITEIIDKLRENRKLPEQADFRLFKQAWLNRFTSLLDPHEEMQYLPDGTVLRTVTVPRPRGGLLMTMEDVTSHLQLETSFNTLMAVQRETIDNLSESIAVYGEDGRLRLANSAFLKVWNLSQDAIAHAPHISKLIEMMKDAFEEKDWAEAKKTLLSIGFERTWRRSRFLRKNGNILEFSVVPLPDGNVMNTFFDVTDTVHVERALHERNAALEEAEKLKADFLANMSYQLRTPLNAMMGFAEILQQQYFGKLNDRQMDYINNMIEAGHRLVSLINDILDLSSIEAGHLRLYAAPVRIRDVMDHVADLTRDWGRKQRLEITIECPDPDLTLTADERRLKQVLLNLVSNAFNYSPNGGVVVLSARREGGDMVLSVQDSGIGIPAADLTRIFTPFDQLERQRKQRRSGAGLGLILVKKIVEMHGGIITLTSEEGVGTEVTCRLPLEPGAQAQNVA